jgi:hypothetical protein
MINGISNNVTSIYDTQNNDKDGLYGQDASEKQKKKMGLEECETCKNRKYQDGSNENVSYKAATHISPESAASAVRAHEGEHVSNAYSKAAQEDGQVVRASVTVYTSICPECGRTYVSGGVTDTAIKYQNEENPYMQDFKEQQGIELRGRNIDDLQ